MKNTNIREVRLFGMALTMMLSFLSVRLFLSGRSFYSRLIMAAGIIFLLSVFAPRVISPLHRLFGLFGRFVSWLITNLVLVLTFYLVVTPIGIILKSLKKDLLGLTRSGQKSYWVKKNEEFQKDRYRQQF